MTWRFHLLHMGIIGIILRFYAEIMSQLQMGWYLISTIIKPSLKAAIWKTNKIITTIRTAVPRPARKVSPARVTARRVFRYSWWAISMREGVTVAARSSCRARSTMLPRPWGLREVPEASFEWPATARCCWAPRDPA